MATTDFIEIYRVLIVYEIYRLVSMLQSALSPVRIRQWSLKGSLRLAVRSVLDCLNFKENIICCGCKSRDRSSVVVAATCRSFYCRCRSLIEVSTTVAVLAPAEVIVGSYLISLISLLLPLPLIPLTSFSPSLPPIPPFSKQRANAQRTRRRSF